MPGPSSHPAPAATPVADTLREASFTSAFTLGISGVNMSIKSAFARRSGALAVAFLALSFSVGGSYVVRADDPEVSVSLLREMVIDPIMKAVNGLDLQLTGLEGTMALFASSFSSHQISARELCVSDESGAQTCITKAQLDTLLAKVMAEAAPQQPAIPLAATESHSEPTEIATVAAHEPVPVPIVAAIDAAQEESQEPEHTGTVTTAISGAALVWYPEVEVSSQATAPREIFQEE